MNYHLAVARVSQAMSALYEFDRRWQIWRDRQDPFTPSVIELSVEYSLVFDSWRFAAGVELARIGKSVRHPALEAEGEFLKMAAIVSNRIDTTLFAYHDLVTKKGEQK